MREQISPSEIQRAMATALRDEPDRIDYSDAIQKIVDALGLMNNELRVLNKYMSHFADE